MTNAAASNLSAEARAAIAAAQAIPFSYVTKTLLAPDGRTLVVLGEAHLKLARAQTVGRAMVKAFDLRGVEGFPRARVFCGRTLGVLISVPRTLLRTLTFQWVKDSTIVDARQAELGFTVPIEAKATVPTSLHIASFYLSTFFIVGVLAPLLGFFSQYLAIPGWLLGVVTAIALFMQLHMVALIPALLLRRFHYHWLVHPLAAIITARDTIMVEGTVGMLADHPEQSSALVIVGRAHVRGFTQELVEKHGFRPQT
jgi:hypothetical protein